MLTLRFAQALCLCSSLWVVAFLLVGGKGKLLSIGIGMIPPLVIAAAAIGTSSTRRNLIVPSKYYGGDWNLYRGVMLLIVSSLLCKIGLSALEYAMTNPQKVANQLGISTLPAIAISLLPVSRYSGILQTCGWTVPHAIHEIHVSLGWYSVWAGSLHVAFYLYVWWTRHEASWRAFVPDLKCLFIEEDEEDSDPCDGCDCSRRMHYLTGAVVGLAFVAIVATSLPYMRRMYYTCFYRVHVIAAPIAVLFLYMHWRKTTLYISGGVIVYLASWVPPYLEQLLRKTPVRVLAIDCVSCEDERDVVVLTCAASKSAVFSAGQYVKLYAPGIAPISHPFTVLAGPVRDGTFQIMFRQIGVFTQSLGHAILQSEEDSGCTNDESEKAVKALPPTIYLDGFHGGVDRLHQMLYHDHVVMVAGGIGITPMLAMISQLVADDAASNASSPLSTVTLHWICRDPALVQYVKGRYFDAWEEMRQHVTLRCVAHNTSSSLTTQNQRIVRRIVSGSDQVGSPFEPSMFSNSSFPLRWRRSTSMSNVAIIGLSTLVVYLLFYNVPTEKNVLKALYAPFFVLVWAAVVSFTVLFSRSSEADYYAVPHSDTCTDGVMLKAKSSFNNNLSTEEGGDCTWEEHLGRPSITEMTKCLDTAAYPAAFLCGPSSLVASLSSHLKPSCCSSSANTAVYIEHFEM